MMHLIFCLTSIATHIRVSLACLLLATAAHAASQQGDEEPAAHGDGAAAVRFVRLPQRISAAELKRTLMDIPGMIDIVDIRPTANFADFSLTGSMNASIANVITNPTYLNGTNPLIIVDRDGSLAMMVAGSCEDIKLVLRCAKRRH